MADLAIITPTRGRPERLERMIYQATLLAHMELEFFVGIDDDDESDYQPLLDKVFANGVRIYVQRLPRMSLSMWTNHLVERALETDGSPAYVASLGDDHAVRTAGWDAKLIGAIERMQGPGFAYGNDLLQGVSLPTAWVSSAAVVRELGWMMLPSCEHMYVDNAILSLGRAADRIAYVPGVTIEHEHPAAGKAKTDASYAESSTQARFEADRLAYEAWRAGQMLKDAVTLMALKH